MSKNRRKSDTDLHQKEFAMLNLAANLYEKWKENEDEDKCLK